MDEKLLVVAILGFFSGYILKFLLGSYQTFMELSFFVEMCADECLKLMGATIYQTSYIEQLYFHLLQEVDVEGSKILKIEMDENFEEWKIHTMNSFVAAYPPKYRWHLEYADWEGAMNKLTDIYKREKSLNGDSTE